MELSQYFPIWKKLSEDQRILHVLNRLGFGARPGDVERVKAMGVDKYIEQQLTPEKIDDSASEAKLQNLETQLRPKSRFHQAKSRNAVPNTKETAPSHDMNLRL
jgi:uncharacterized protein (DUF1800 family)